MTIDEAVVLVAVQIATEQRPGMTFDDLVVATRARFDPEGPEVGAAEIDKAARELGLEHGEPGAYRYQRRETWEQIEISLPKA